MKEYICKEVQTENGGYLEIEKELIRCKDCRYLTESDMMLSTSDGAQERMTICKLTHTGRFGSDYCSRAVPKETE